MIRFLLDTNTISEPSRKRPNPGVLAKLRRYEGEVAICAPSWQELIHGWGRLPESHTKAALWRYLAGLRKEIPILPYDSRAARWHGEERARLYDRTPPFNDSQIAAVAAVNDLVLVTANTADFLFFPSLTVENWVSRAP